MGMRGAFGCGIYPFDLVSYAFSYPRTYGTQKKELTRTTLIEAVLRLKVEKGYLHDEKAATAIENGERPQKGLQAKPLSCPKMHGQIYNILVDPVPLSLMYSFFWLPVPVWDTATPCVLSTSQNPKKIRKLYISLSHSLHPVFCFLEFGSTVSTTWAMHFFNSS